MAKAPTLNTESEETDGRLAMGAGVLRIPDQHRQPRP